ncbi:MAG: PTS sugar transporter subunit IIC [bacterium]|nr:PTS sugar transporter subunit IIC [bacterium]
MIAEAMSSALAGTDWVVFGSLAALAGCLALDETAAAQTWLSQPLPAALLAGAVAGDPALGLAVGLPLQLALTMNLPVGQTITGDVSGAAVAVVGAAAVGGSRPGWPIAPHDASLTGWLVLGAALLSLAGHPLVQAERRLHLVWMLQGHRTLRDGRLGRVDAIHGRCLAAGFLRGTLFAGAALLLVTTVWLPLHAMLPPVAGAAMAWLPWLAGALGLGAVAERYGALRHWRWVIGGLACGWLAGVVA